MKIRELRFVCDANNRTVLEFKTALLLMIRVFPIDAVMFGNRLWTFRQLVMPRYLGVKHINKNDIFNP